MSSKEAITHIREAEVKATAIRERAMQEAAERVEKNQRACADRMSRAIETTERDLQAKLADVQVKADALIEQSREEARADVGGREKIGRTQVRDAVKMIVWEMHNSCQ